MTPMKSSSRFRWSSSPSDGRPSGVAGEGIAQEERKQSAADPMTLDDVRFLRWLQLNVRRCWSRSRHRPATTTILMRRMHPHLRLASR